MPAVPLVESVAFLCDRLAAVERRSVRPTGSRDGEQLVELLSIGTAELAARRVLVPTGRCLVSDRQSVSIHGLGGSRVDLSWSAPETMTVRVWSPQEEATVTIAVDHDAAEELAFSLLLLRRVCPEPGCPAVVKRGRCPEHRRERGRAWRRLVAEVVERDHGVCWLCGEPGATSADHLIRVRDGGDDSIANCAPRTSSAIVAEADGWDLDASGHALPRFVSMKEGVWSSAASRAGG